MAGVVAVALLVGTCSRLPPVLEQIRWVGELRVVTRNSPTAYYLGRLGPEGPEYELAAAFARRLGVPLSIRLADSQADAVEEVRRNRAHIAAAGLSVAAAFRQRVAFGPVYQRIKLHVIRHRGGHPARDVRGLAGFRIEVPRDTAQADALAAAAAQAERPIQWSEVEGVSQLDLFARLSARRIDFTVADSTEFSLGRHFHPELQVAFDLPEVESLAWALRQADDGLMRKVVEFFGAIEADGSLAALLDRYYGDPDSFDYIDSLNFVRHAEERLPPLRPLFESAATGTGLDWRLLAAIGYQESKWDPDAVSRTGVRGVMMLTEDTAERVGVTDRRDPRESIRGGAVYFIEILGKLPPRIREPDRTWFALAAYNIGFGHLEDARILAQRAGKDPDRWDDVRRYVPLLAQEQHFTTTKRGYARGWEAVRFVANVQTYLQLLEWMTGAPDNELRLPATVDLRPFGAPDVESAGDAGPATP